MRRLCFTLLLLASACRDARTRPTLATFSDGMASYLETRGDLCLGRPSWPIDVSERAFRIRSRDALQLPVLERLGLATSTTLPDGRRYQLTALGRRSYVERRRDLCAGHLSLDKVVGWQVAGRSADVAYTYRLEPAAWARDPEARKVFPVVDRAIRGAGQARRSQGFTLTRDGWIAAR